MSKSKQKANFIAGCSPRTVHSSFWVDSKVLNMTLEERHLFLYILTSPHSNTIGFYELPLPVVAKETGLHEDEVKKLLKLLQNKYKVIDFDWDTSEVLVCNWAKYSWNSNSNKFLAGLGKYYKNAKNQVMKKYVNFLVEHKFGITTWERDACDYRTGNWKKEVG